MRILAIRGQNLASLAGSFAVELAAGPLAEAGLILVTGPTGAGKSTLLDALCLALFGEAPRLMGAQGAGLLGTEDELQDKDPRVLLRRGTGEGFAEVDFLGEDGRRYRARWEVRRARRKPAGNLQQAGMRLEDLDAGQVIASRLTETREEVIRRLGLDFGQFTRGVLLAQGDFAAFLRARGDERAELLARVTGTGVYRLLSRAAHQRRAEEEARHRGLEGEQAGVPMLGVEERAALEAETASAEAAWARAEAERQAAEARVRWHDELARSREEERQAREEAARAEADRARAEPIRRALAEVERAEPLRALRSADREAARRLEAARALERTRVEAHGLSGEAAEAAARLRTEAQRMAAAERARSLELRPALEAALRLDALLAEDAPRLDAARAEAEAQAGKLAALEAELEVLRARRAEADGEHRVARAWLEPRAWLSPLRAAWPLLASDLKRALERATTAEQGESYLGPIAAEQRRVAGALEATRARLATEEAEIASLDGALEAVRVELAHTDRGALEARRAALERELQASERLRASAERLAELGREDLAREARQQQAEEDREATRRRLRQVESALEELRELRIAATEAMRQAEAVRALESRRAELAPGRPCPLCGSREHPWAAGLPAVSEADDPRLGLAALEADVETQEQERRELEGALRGAEARLQELGHQAREQAAERARELERGRELLESLPAERRASVPAAADAPEALEQRAALRFGLQAEAAEVDTQLRAVAEALERSQLLGIRLNEAHRRRAKVAEDLRVTDEGLRDVQACLARIQAEASRAREGLAEVAARLGAALAEAPDEVQALADDPEAALEALESVAAEHAQREALAAAATEELARLIPELAARESGLEAARASAAEAARKAAQDAARLEARRAERAALLEGRPTAEVQAEQERRGLEAEASLQAATDGARAAGEALSAAEAEARAAREERAERERERAEIAEALAQGIAAVGLGPEALETALAHPPGWLLERRAELEALQARLDRAQAVLDERVRRREQLERGPGSTGAASADEARTALDQAEALARERLEALERARVGLAQDDRARTRAAELQEAVARSTEAMRVWRELDELIGHGDGRKLQRFAQGLNLANLAELANHHLAGLAPRYALAPSPGERLDLLIVDHDLGDQPRPLPSLSGGETFLVSLALALGLSSLNAGRTSLGSLFIDEGFGSLDGATLQVALGALEALQAGGCQITLISHVPELVERIGHQVRIERVAPGRSRVRVPGEPFGPPLATRPPGEMLG